MKLGITPPRQRLEKKQTRKLITLRMFASGCLKSTKIKASTLVRNDNKKIGNCKNKKIRAGKGQPGHTNTFARLAEKHVWQHEHSGQNTPLDRANLSPGHK